MNYVGAEVPLSVFAIYSRVFAIYSVYLLSTEDSFGGTVQGLDFAHHTCNWFSLSLLSTMGMGVVGKIGSKNA